MKAFTKPIRSFEFGPGNHFRILIASKGPYVCNYTSQIHVAVSCKPLKHGQHNGNNTYTELHLEKLQLVLQLVKQRERALETREREEERRRENKYDFHGKTEVLGRSPATAETWRLVLNLAPRSPLIYYSFPS